MNVVPLGEYIVVKRDEAEATTTGGILLPEGTREKSLAGRVLAVGDGRQLPNGQRAQHLVSEGDRVLFSAYAGATVTVDGEDLLIMSEDEILAVVK